MIEILYDDNNFTGVVKPVGIPVQPDKTGDKSLIEVLEMQINHKLWLINRLDRNVGGVMFFAKNKESVSQIDEKRYKAVLCGVPQKEGRVENWLMKNQRLNISKVVNKGTQGAKRAVLEYKTEKTIDIDGEKYSLADIRLETGRHHQIRVQMANLGYPLCGDVKYNKSCRRSDGIMLWSYRAVIGSVAIEKLPYGGIWDKFADCNF